MSDDSESASQLSRFALFGSESAGLWWFLLYGFLAAWLVAEMVQAVAVVLNVWGFFASLRMTAR